MTREQLYNHFSLRQELVQAKEVLDSLRAAASPGAQTLTGMPHAPGVTDKTGELAAEIVDMEQEVQRIHDAIEQEEPEIVAFISTIKNGRTRTIFRLRLLKGLSWKEIAAVMGQWTSTGSVRTAFHAYLRKETRKDKT